MVESIGSLLGSIFLLKGKLSISLSTGTASVMSERGVGQAQLSAEALWSTMASRKRQKCPARMKFVSDHEDKKGMKLCFWWYPIMKNNT
jgi:hypothetical protein